MQKKPMKVLLVEEGVEYGVYYGNDNLGILSHYNLVVNSKGELLITEGNFIVWDEEGEKEWPRFPDHIKVVEIIK